MEVGISNIGYDKYFECFYRLMGMSYTNTMYEQYKYVNKYL